MKNPKVKVSRVLSNDRIIKASSNEEVEKFFETCDSDSTFVVEFQQEVPVGGGSILNLSNRLVGHSKSIEIKETKTLVAWLSGFTVAGYKKENLFIGKEIEGVSIKEHYLFPSKLSLNFGLDNKGNVVQGPIVNPQTNEVLLYDNNGYLEPLFRFTELVVGEYKPTIKRSYDAKQEGFQGQEKQSNGKKTEEFQEWLNNLYSTYVSTKQTGFEIDIPSPVKELKEVL